MGSRDRSSPSADIENGELPPGQPISLLAESSADTTSTSSLLLEKLMIENPTEYWETKDSVRPGSKRIDPRIISDATIGLSDGLTVPFALTAGLSAFGSSKVVIFGGFAELIAGAISMGLGGWLASRSEADAHKALLGSTHSLVHHSPRHAIFLIREKIAPLVPSTAAPLLDELSSQMLQQHRSQDPQVSQKQHDSRLTELLMCLHYQTSASSPDRAFTSAFIIAASYFTGGLVPLIPYFFIAEVGHALWWSIGVMIIALGTFGAAKTLLLSTGAMTEEQVGNINERLSTLSQIRIKMLMKCLKGSALMILLGSAAAAASMVLVMGLTQHDSTQK